MDKTMRKSMGTIELCFDVDSDSDIESDNETIKKEHYSDEELGSIKVESVMTLKEFKNKEYDITECNIKLKPLNIKSETVKVLNVNFPTDFLPFGLSSYDLLDNQNKVDVQNVTKDNTEIKFEHLDILKKYEGKGFKKQVSSVNENVKKMSSYFVQDNEDSDKHFEADFSEINESKIKLKPAQKYKCNQCDKAYTTSQNLKFHVQHVHEKLKPQYKCPKCDKAYKHYRYLKYHVQYVHEGLKPKHKCSECDKYFRQVDSLKYHVQYVHKNLKNCKNSISSKSEKIQNGNDFIDTISAPYHEDMKEDPPNISAQNEVMYDYTCSRCGSKFESLSQYYDHISNCQLWQAEQNSEQNTSVQNDDGDKEYYCHFCKDPDGNYKLYFDTREEWDTHYDICPSNDI